MFLCIVLHVYFLFMRWFVHAFHIYFNCSCLCVLAVVVCCCFMSFCCLMSNCCVVYIIFVDVLKPREVYCFIKIGRTPADRRCSRTHELVKLRDRRTMGQFGHHLANHVSVIRLTAMLCVRSSLTLSYLQSFEREEVFLACSVLAKQFQTI